MSRVSLAELKAAGIVIRADEAAAIVREVCRQYSARAAAGIPRAETVKLAKNGRMSINRALNMDAAPIPAAVALLESVTTEMPGGMRLVLARATGALDAPPFASIDEFSAALERFAAVDLRETAKGLYRAWATLQPPVSSRYGWWAAAAALVVILLGLFAVPSRAPATSHRVVADSAPSAPPPAPDRNDAVADVRDETPPVTAEAPLVKPEPRKTVHRTAPPPPPPRKSFFKRELFRVVIK